LKALAISLLILISICFTQTADPDSLNTSQRTIGSDKIQHAAVSCLLTLGSQYVFVNKSSYDEHKALSYSVSSSAIIGIAKEFNDSNQLDGRFSWGDILANSVGIAIAVFIITQ